jgi:hypothetical protein
MAETHRFLRATWKQVSKDRVIAWPDAEMFTLATDVCHALA